MTFTLLLKGIVLLELSDICVASTQDTLTCCVHLQSEELLSMGSAYAKIEQMYGQFNDGVQEEIT
jgi:hypothetical protein